MDVTRARPIVDAVALAARAASAYMLRPGGAMLPALSLILPAFSTATVVATA